MEEEDVVFVVGVTIYPHPRSDDVSHFHSGYPLFITTSRRKAINQALDLEADFEQYQDRWEQHYVGITVMESRGESYVPAEYCKIPGILDHHIGVEGLIHFEQLPESCAEMDDDLWCVGVIGDMQYFTGCFLTLTKNATDARNTSYRFKQCVVEVEHHCKQRVSSTGGTVWWKK